jgi:hypothetical protein
LQRSLLSHIVAQVALFSRRASPLLSLYSFHGFWNTEVLSMEEITELQLITALQEAFTCYLAYLSHTQKSRESKLPRQGKDIETTSNLSTQHNFLSRIAATETCLQYTRKIARNVKRWNSNPVDQAREECITGGVPEVVSLETLVKDLEDITSLSWIPSLDLGLTQ